MLWKEIVLFENILEFCQLHIFLSSKIQYFLFWLNQIVWVLVLVFLFKQVIIMLSWRWGKSTKKFARLRRLNYQMVYMCQIPYFAYMQNILCHNTVINNNKYVIFHIYSSRCMYFFSMNYIKLIIFDCLSIKMVISYDPTKYTHKHTCTLIFSHATYLFISSGPARWIRSTQICRKERQTLKITLILCWQNSFEEHFSTELVWGQKSLCP